ncbi:hypothetical protein OUZ56_029096 [Daphnia magna]|uniref:Uncharacterized protein n=1 Tax=Daphnia magna TaxID=35525 RepID=A0ABR0B5U5_9CRUS|nr:hypothetical protein OUZ56_029096 [Daphnia magna]
METNISGTASKKKNERKISADTPEIAAPSAPSLGRHMSSPRPSPSLHFARRPIFASPSPSLCFARRPVFALPVTPSSLCPSPHLRFVRRLVFASWSPPLHFVHSSPRLCGIVVFCKV